MAEPSVEPQDSLNTPSTQLEVCRCWTIGDCLAGRLAGRSHASLNELQCYLHPQVRQIAADLFPGVLTPSAHTLACCAGAEGDLQHEASVPTALVREVSLGIAGVGMPKPRPKPGRPCFPEGSP